MGTNFVAGKAPFINELYNVWPRNIEKVCCLLRGEFGFLGHYADRFPCRFDCENFLQGFGDLAELRLFARFLARIYPLVPVNLLPPTQN